MALVAGQIAKLGEILEPEQFALIMQMAIRPLVQLKIPGHPADVHFEKERVTATESFEKECSNKVLPRPFSPKLDKIPPKHPTRCKATTVCMILCKKLLTPSYHKPSLLVTLQYTPKSSTWWLAEGNMTRGRNIQNVKPTPLYQPPQRNISQ